MPVIKVENLPHEYCPHSPYKKVALCGISLTVERGEFLGIVGANGSGKTTLIKHFNGLLTPTKGKVVVCGKDTSNKQERNGLWRKVGLVFQFPEQQLFEATVFDDVAYGPKNMGLDSSEIKHRVEDSLNKVGLDRTLGPLSPLSLSGGLRRRVAIAGVLAMRPQILILDEPTAGLDPQGNEQILQVIKNLQKQEGTTIIMVSHSLKDILSLADQVAVLQQGRLAAYGPPRKVLAKPLKGLDLVLPVYLQLIFALAERGKPVNTSINSITEAEAEIVRILEEVKQCEA